MRKTYVFEDNVSKECYTKTLPRKKTNRTKTEVKGKRVDNTYLAFSGCTMIIKCKV